MIITYLMCSTKTKRNRKDVWPKQEFQVTKTCPISWKKWHNGVFLKVDNLKHGRTLFFPFFIFMILSVEQMNLDDNMHNKTKKVMLEW